MYASLPSLNSIASLAPVDAPLGTITPAVRRFSNTTLHATVGTPLESKT